MGWGIGTNLLLWNKKFGAHDYREAIEELLELKQTDTVEQYVTAFEDL